MKITLDFEENTITTEQGTMIIPELSQKKKDIYDLLGLEEISAEELRKDIRNLLDDLGYYSINV